MRPMTSTWVVAGLLLAVCDQPAYAQAPSPFNYEWHRDGQPVSGSIEVPAGSSFTLQVYIREQSGGTVLQTERLNSAGVLAHYGSTAGVIQVPNTASISRNPAFSEPSYYLAAVNNPEYAQFSAAVEDTEPGVTPDANNRIWLGSFTFQVLGGVGSSTLLRAEDIPPTDDTTVTSLGRELDADLVKNPPTLTVVVVPVPEPATLTLVGAVGLATAQMARRRWWKRLSVRNECSGL